MVILEGIQSRYSSLRLAVETSLMGTYTDTVNEVSVRVTGR